MRTDRLPLYFSLKRIYLTETYLFNPVETNILTQLIADVFMWQQNYSIFSQHIRSIESSLKEPLKITFLNSLVGIRV